MNHYAKRAHSPAPVKLFRSRSPLATAALIEGALFILFVGTFPLIHSGGIGILGVLFSLPQTPGLLVAGVIGDLLVGRFGSAPDYIGVPVYFALIFIVQWLLVAVLVVLWRTRVPRGSNTTIFRDGG